MRSGGSMRAQIGTLVLATSCHPARQWLLWHLHFLASGDRELRRDHGRSGAQQLFRRLHARRIALRTHHRADRAHPRLCRLCRPRRRRDCGHATPGWRHCPGWLLRAVIGFGCAGIFVTTESWLNAKAQPSERGRVFSVYMVGTFLALAAGQLLIGRAKIETAAPFNAIVALFAVALVMVSATRAEPPRTTGDAAPVWPTLACGARGGRRLRG